MKQFFCQLLLIASVLIVITGCDQNRVFEKYKSIPESGWNKDSLISFDIPVESTTQNHNLYINVRNEITYSYIDSRGRLRETRLCLRLKDGICETKKIFSSGDYNLTVSIKDEAGNVIEKDANFTV